MATNPVKRRITVYYDISEALIAAATTAAQVLALPSSSSSSSSSPSPSSSSSPSPSPSSSSSSSSFKRIRRMPHLFDRVIELPVDSDAPVRIEESASAFTFTTALPDPHLLRNSEIRAEFIEIVPGVTKVSVSGIYRPPDSPYLLDNVSPNFNTIHRNLETAHRRDLRDAPLWRFRLPEDSIPQDSVATCDGDGILVLTVPKKSKSLSSGPSLLEAYQQVRRRPLSIPSSESSDSEEVEIDTEGFPSLQKDLKTLAHEKVLDNEDYKDKSVQSLNESDESQNLNGKVPFDESSQTHNENDSSHKSQALNVNGKACDRSQNQHEKDFPDALQIPNEKSFLDESLQAPGEKASSDVEFFQTLNEKIFSDGLALDDEPEMVISISACGAATEVDTR